MRFGPAGVSQPESWQEEIQRISLSLSSSGKKQAFNKRQYQWRRDRSQGYQRFHCRHYCTGNIVAEESEDLLKKRRGLRVASQLETVYMYFAVTSAASNSRERAQGEYK